jgi:hypothetical protein
LPSPRLTFDDDTTVDVAADAAEQAALLGPLSRWAMGSSRSAVTMAAPQYAAPPPPAPAAPAVDLVGELTKLGELKAAGVLSEAEFEVAKAKLLG